ncbi:hypothetical protein [Nocardioides plantarum]|uniref:Nucleotidyl transferase AbiEii toxin, Type IV TA system n=1 Tax=Nocardioides plantarum TaxID=29299 RepID=A0ABV5KGU0_9ACTN|nr:hypothetical protein [Nocardioides plantarum]
MTLREYDPGAILAVLVERRVDFVLIGGLAAISHGSPFPTEDVDVTPERSRHNLDRLSDALRELGARIRADGIDDGLPFEHDGASLAAADVWNLVTDRGDLDISMVPSGTDGYADLLTDSAGTEIMGVGVRVASLADVIRSKQAANRPKDQRVLPTLRELLDRRRG